MLWYQMDADTPTHPTSREILVTLGNEGFGAMVRLWCYAAQYGGIESEPGRCVDREGRPIPEIVLRDASGLDEQSFETLVGILVATECMDKKLWESRREMFFPGMAKRGSEYSKKVIRKQKQSNNRTLFGERPSSVRYTSTDTDTVRGTKRKNKKVTTDADRERAKAMIDLWNEIVEPPVPKVRQLNDDRLQAVASLPEEWSLDRLRKCFEIFNANPWFQGKENKKDGGYASWKGSFEFAISRDAKYLLRSEEGHYTKSVPIGTTRSTGGKYAKVERGRSSS